MDIYVESNFVLQLALQQEGHRSCRDIVDLCERGSARLVIPAFCVPEAHYALIGKQKQRDQLIQASTTEQGQLLRSERYKDRSQQLRTARSLLIAGIARDSEDFRRCSATVLQAASVIPLNSHVLRSAAELEKSTDMKLPDAMVLASVMADLDARKPEEACFLTRNSKDFDDPDVVHMLAQRGCKIFFSFDDCLSYIRSHLR